MTEPAPPPPTPAWRIFALPALLALTGYLLLYGCDRHLRTRNGPWEVTFLHDADGTPALRIAHPNFGITSVLVRFLHEQPGPTSNPLPATIQFGRPRMPIPFGVTAFDDLMYLPGTVVLHCFGHEVQLLPRALFLNREEQAWRDGAAFDLHPTNKLPSLAPPTASRRTPVPAASSRVIPGTAGSPRHPGPDATPAPAPAPTPPDPTAAAPH